MKVAGAELANECDYLAEAEHITRFGRHASEFNSYHNLSPQLHVPNVVPELSTMRVVTTELAPGHPIDYARELTQDQRDTIGTQLLRLSIEELFFWRFMQTDPNWSNFLYDGEDDRISLIDFGACREYSEEFRDAYVEMIHACSTKDKSKVERCSLEMGFLKTLYIDYFLIWKVERYSLAMGFLNGDENELMVNAHVDAAILIGEPFATPGPFDFRKQDVTEEVKDLTKVMLKHRLSPPPDEVYSLHRKLAGTFQTCVHLGARVDCHRVFMEAYERHQESQQRKLAQGDGPGLN